MTTTRQPPPTPPTRIAYRARRLLWQLTIAATLMTTGCTTAPRALPAPITTTTVRTDPAPITNRFPHLPPILAVHWQATLIGDNRIPGPTGIIIHAIIRLDPNQVATLTTNYQWTPAATSQDVAITPALRPFAPAHAHWRSSPGYTNHIQDTRYAGLVWVDPVNATIYLNLTD